jgi:uncharacterized Zn-binding protein involved in type VI secretion
MPLAARISDRHTCPVAAHEGGPATSGEPTVIVGHRPAARVGDTLACKHASDTIVAGERSVQIGFRDAARLGDATAHGGVVVAGCPTVIIGSFAQAEALRTTTPFVEDCKYKSRKREGERLMAEHRKQAAPAAADGATEGREAK